MDFHFLIPEEEEKLERNLVWIFGANRSGTSWLARQLLSCDKIVGIDEPLIGQHLGIVLENQDQMTKIIEKHSKRPNYFF